jgi:hypothetical protein
MSVFILVDMYRLSLYTVVRVGRIYKCFFFDIVAGKGRVSEVRQTLLLWRNGVTEAVQWERVVYSVSRFRGAGCAVESLGQLCGAEQRVLVDTAARSAGCEL